MPDVVELSGTGVPPGLLNEVVERRSGAFRLKLSTGPNEPVYHKHHNPNHKPKIHISQLIATANQKANPEVTVPEVTGHPSLWSSQSYCSGRKARVGGGGRVANSC